MCLTYFLSALKTQKPSAVKKTKNTINEKIGKIDTPSMLFKISLNIVLFIYESKVQCSTLIIDRGQWNFD
jgi:hypothetical protein